MPIENNSARGTTTNTDRTIATWETTSSLNNKESPTNSTTTNTTSNHSNKSTPTKVTYNYTINFASSYITCQWISSYVLKYTIKGVPNKHKGSYKHTTLWASIKYSQCVTYHTIRSIHKYLAICKDWNDITNKIAQKMKTPTYNFLWFASNTSPCTRDYFLIQ